MRAAVRIVGKMIYRNLALVLPYAIYLVFMVGYCVFHLFNYIQYRPMNTELYMGSIEMILYAALAGYAIFLYLGFELGVRLRESQLQETVQSLPNGVLRYMGAVLVHLVLLAFVGETITLVTYGILYRMEGVPDGAVLLHQTMASLLYMFLTPLTASCMGLAVARVTQGRRLLAYPMVILLVVLTTGYLDRFFLTWYWSDGGYLSGHLPYRIKDWFTFTPYGMAKNYGFDPNYGLPIEAARWFLLVFWIGLSSLLVLFPWVRQRSKRWVALSCGLLILVGGGVFADRGMLVVSDERPISAIVSHEDSDYNLRYPMAEESPGFAVEKYDIQLSLWQKLRAKVTMTLSPLDAGRERYVFTLHRYLKVSSIKNGAGAKIPFLQEGNLVSVAADDVDGRLTMEYKGSLPAYYSNEQAVALPAFFSWYPMAGSRPVQLGGSDNLAIPTAETEFVVSVQAPYAVCSNLPGEENYFAGNSVSVTLMGGLLMQEAVLDDIAVCKGRTVRYVPISEMLGNINSIVAKINARLGEEVLRNPDDMFHKIFVYPDSFETNRVAAGYVDGQDHLLVSAFCLYSEEWFAQSYMTSGFHPGRDFTMLYSIFPQHLLGYRAEDEGVSMNNDPEVILDKLEYFAKGEYEGNEVSTLRVYLYYALEYLEAADSDAMLRVHEWLCTPPIEDNEFTFLSDMMKEAMGQ